MNSQRAFDLGLVAGVLVMIGANAVYWFVGGHPPASSIRTGLVWVQMIVGLGGAVALLLRRPRNARP